MISERVVRDIEDVGRAREECLDELRRLIWRTALSEMQGVDRAKVSVVKCKYGYQVRAEL